MKQYGMEAGNKYRDQWNIIEMSEIDPSVYMEIWYMT